MSAYCGLKFMIKEAIEGKREEELIQREKKRGSEQKTFLA